MKDVVVVALLVALALLFSAHIAIAYGLARRAPQWRAAVAFVVMPLAPYWAWRERMKVRAGIWAGGIVLYVAAVVVARF